MKNVEWLKIVGHLLAVVLWVEMLMWIMN